MKNVFNLIMTTFLLFGASAYGAECVKSKPASYSREANIPLWIDSSGDNAYIFFSNVLDDPMTLEVELIASDGTTYTGATSIGGAFTSNPTAAGGASLPAGATGYLGITNNSAFTFGTGKVIWTSEACLQDSLMISINQTQSQQTQVFRLNGGKPF